MSLTNCFIICQNLGLPCIPTLKRALKWILVPTYANDGTLNELDLSAGPFDATFFAALVNHADPSKRWYPLPEIKNVTDERGDPSAETADDGTGYITEEAVRKVVGHIFAGKAPAQLVGRIKSFNSSGEFSVYAVDTDFSLIGKEGSSATMFAPIRITASTIWAGLIKAQGKDTVQKIKIMYDVSTLEKDEDLRVILAEQMDFNPAELNGLVDITGTISNVTTTGFRIALQTPGGTLIDPIMDEGLVAADFVSSTSGVAQKVRRTNNTPADVDITTATEVADGVYDIVIPLATAADTLQPFAKKDGRDYTQLKSLVVTIP